MSLEIALPGEPGSYWPALLLVPLLGWALPRAGRPVSSVWIAGTAALFLGGFWLSLHPLAAGPPVNAEPGERVVAEGCVDSAVTRTPERVQFLLRTRDGARIQAGVYPRAGETLPVIRHGQVLEVEGRLRAPRNFRNPGSFDYERYLARKGVFWLISATGAENLHTSGLPCGASPLAEIHRLREALLARAATRFEAYPEARAWLSAILLGDDSMLPETTLESYCLAGVYHVLVISGQHVAILAAAFLPFFRLLPLPRSMACFLTALLCWGYALVAGYEVPALRAAMAVTLYLAGSLVFRRARPLNLLALIALLFLAWDPGQLLDASFQLSFVAVLAISGIAIPLQRVLFGNWAAVVKNLGDSAMDLRLPPKAAEARVELRLLARGARDACRLPEKASLWAMALLVRAVTACCSLVLFSLVVQVVLAPLLIQDFHRAPLIAPFSNLLLSPILGVAIPAAFLDLALPIPLLRGALAWAVHLTNGLIGFLAANTPDFRVPDIPPPLLILITAAIAAVILVWEPRARREALRERREAVVLNSGRIPIRSGRWLIASLALMTSLVGLSLAYPFAAAVTPGEWELTMLDVGQGDATLLLAPTGSAVLVDTGGLGGYSASSRIDTGEDILAPYLWSRGIRRIDTLVLSHLDYDHAGGAPAILRIFKPRHLRLAANPGPHPLWEEIRAAAAAAGARIEFHSAGDSWESGGVLWRVLHPDAGQMENRYAPASSNDDSLVLHASYARISALFTGDLHRTGELEIVSRGEVPRAGVLKVAHHGSRTSTSEPFLNEAAPSIALISAGWLNAYGHPHAEVVARLQSRGVAVFRTDRDGAITLRGNGRFWRYGGVE